MSNLEQMLVRVREGDSTAEGDILQAMMHDIEGLAGALSKSSPVDRDDLISDGSLAVLMAIRGDTPGHDASFRTFAVTCARNAMISRLRKRASRPAGNVDSVEFLAIQDEVKADAPESISDLEGMSEVADIACGAVKQMSPEQQKLVLLYAQGKHADDIAEELGCETYEIEDRLERALGFISFEIQLQAPEHAEKFSRYCRPAGDPDKPLLAFMRG